MAWVLGVFSAFMGYGWLEGQSDRYAGIAWRKELDTCVNWDLALQRARRQSDRLREGRSADASTAHTKSGEAEKRMS
jgi:hypothetical protein